MRFNLFSEEANQQNLKKDQICSDDKSQDLGCDGAFKPWNVLFIILYQSNPEKRDEEGNIIDEDVNDKNLEEGPIRKLREKGFGVTVVYDYYNAIFELRKGIYRVAIITCSPGTGELPQRNPFTSFSTKLNLSQPDKDYLLAFIECLIVFNRNHGGIFWFLENPPCDFEAEVFFKYHSGDFRIDDVCKEKSDIMGGQYCECKKRDGNTISEKDYEADPGTFITVGENLFAEQLSLPLDFGLTKIFEGVTLADLNEDVLKEKGFMVFAREHTGKACIMLRKEQEQMGRMIIDTAASKLYKDWNSEFTSRYFSNAVIWLLNMEGYFTENNMPLDVKADLENAEIPEYYTHVNMEDFDGKFERNEDPRYPFRKVQEPANFTFSFVADTCGRNHPYVHDLLKFFKNSMKQLEDQYNKVKDKYPCKIRSQIVYFSNYDDAKVLNETGMSDANTFNIDTELKKPGNGCCMECSDCIPINLGMMRAIENIQACGKGTHIILLITSRSMHGLNPECPLKNPKKFRQSKYKHLIKGSFDEEYDYICSAMVKENIQVILLPIFDESPAYRYGDKLASYIDENIKIAHNPGSSYVKKEKILIKEDSYDDDFSSVADSVQKLLDEYIADEFRAFTETI